MEVATMSDITRTRTLANTRVLIADDQPHILDALQLMLKGCGFCTKAVSHPAQVLTALKESEFDAVLLDLNYTRDTTAGQEGLDLVSHIRETDKLLPLLVMTAWGSVDQAVEAMQRGASDFVQKPWSNKQLLEKLHTQLHRAELLRRAQSQREEELREAQEIHDKLLPKELPEVPGFEFAAMTQPLRFVGGDYHTLLNIGPQHTALCIADVCGKGMPAALLMSSLQAALQPLIAEGVPAHVLCQRLNRVLCDVTPVGKFISLFYAVLDSARKQLTYCNAGHNPPLLIRADGTVTQLNAGGAVLGQFHDWRYEANVVEIARGDTLVLFTDGLVEAFDTEHESFGEEKMIELVRSRPDASADDLLTTLIQAVSDHCEDKFHDDASVIVVKAM
jgi:phosphoserine phosphatase RsbU/P